MGIFRQEALDAKRDEGVGGVAFKVVPTRFWVGLVGLLLLATALITWFAFGSATVTASGSGLLVPEEGLADVGSSVAGEVRSVTVNPGEQVAVGQTVAKVLGSGRQPIPVVSDWSGTVEAVYVKRGDYTELGNPIVRLLPQSDPAMAIVFVPSDRASGLNVGSSATVSPAGIAVESYGQIRGTVSYVSSTPISPMAATSLFADAALAEELLAGYPKLEVRIQLESDTSTDSGYAWTGGSGPPHTVQLGSFVTATIELSSSRPISDLVGKD